MNTQKIGESIDTHQPEAMQSPVQETTTAVQERVQNASISENTDETSHAEAVEYITRYLNKNMPNIFSQAEI